MVTARARHFALMLLCSLASCGAQAPKAAAPPPTVTTPAPPAVVDAPLVPYELKEPADVARAFREHYTKYVQMIPMRDGTRLYTAMYVPKDQARKYPIMLLRTPYGIAPYGVDNTPSEKNPRSIEVVAPSAAFVRDGFIFVQQDVRGRMMSEGAFADVRPRRAGVGPKDIDEATDAWDTIDWLVKNAPANNGKVGAWGISYPGFYAAQASIDAHPALKAVSPQAPVTEWFIGDDFHRNGALCIADAMGFYANFGKVRPKPTAKWAWDFDTETGDIYDFYLRLGPVANANARYLEGKIPFWNDIVQHGTRDAFWQARDPRPHYKATKPAVMTVGGWFDAENLWGALETYRSIERQGRGENTLVMGPWFHGGWARSEGDRLGDLTFGAKTSLTYREQVELPFFKRHLKGARVTPQAEAVVFETGTNRWQAFPSWPPAGVREATLFFHGKGGLDESSPRLGEEGAGADAFVSDPGKPVPYQGAPSSRIDREYMVADQRFASRRPDVVVYKSGELESDVTIAGAIEADLWVTTTGTDADWVVKVVDVFPENAEDPQPNPKGVRMGGYQALVRANVMRGKFRSSFEKPEPFKAGEPTRVRFSLPDVLHTFRAGHRIMVHVQSTWFPLVDRNPQRFLDIYQAKDSDFQTETHRILRTPERASSLRVNVLRGRLPANAGPANTGR